jgi:hypothetical protein
MVDIENVVRLTKRIKEIRMLCIGDGNALTNAFHLNTKKDLRITSIIRLTRMITGLNVSFLYLSKLDQNVILEEIKLPFEENIDIEQYLLSNEVFLKLGFSSSLFFIVEGVLKNYLQFLDENAYKNTKGIKKICNCLLEEKLEWDIVKFDCSVFDFLRLIRNTLHSNGIHLPLSANEKNVSIEYKEKIYRFIDGERINFVTWDLLLEIANDMRALLFHLANNKKIREIKGLIPDTFAI